MNLIPFQFESGQLRVIERDGSPWFAAADVCTALGIANARDAIEKLDVDEKGVASTDTLGGRQTIGVVSESGLYALILRCRDAMTAGSAPHRFRKWVTATVLPELRRAGTSITVPQTLSEALRLAADLADKNTALAAQVAEQAPKVAALERIAESEGSMCLTDTAKHLKMPPRAFCKWMADRMWIFRRGNQWAAFQHRIDHGFLVHKVVVLRAAQEDEPERTVTQVRVTSKGLAHLARLLESVPDRTAQAADAAATAVRALH